MWTRRDCKENCQGLEKNRAAAGCRDIYQQLVCHFHIIYQTGLQIALSRQCYITNDNTKILQPLAIAKTITEPLTAFLECGNWTREDKLFTLRCGGYHSAGGGRNVGPLPVGSLCQTAVEGTGRWTPLLDPPGRRWSAVHYIQQWHKGFLQQERSLFPVR